MFRQFSCLVKCLGVHYIMCLARCLGHLGVLATHVGVCLYHMLKSCLNYVLKSLIISLTYMLPELTIDPQMDQYK